MQVFVFASSPMHFAIESLYPHASERFLRPPTFGSIMVIPIPLLPPVEMMGTVFLFF